jgi:hypothetical protein
MADLIDGESETLRQVRGIMVTQKNTQAEPRETMDGRITSLEHRAEDLERR